MQLDLYNDYKVGRVFIKKSRAVIKGGQMSAMQVSRRQFIKLSAGALGAVAAAEAAAWGLDIDSLKKDALRIPIKTGRQVPSICPYCSVGCGQIVMVNDAGKIINIEGNPDSPLSEGTLCPKGAATYQLVNNENRWTRVKYRAPGSDHWEEKPLDWAMDRIAQLVKKTRDDNFNEYEEVADIKGDKTRKRVMNTYAVASLGGATIDNEWNYLQQKLMHGIGVVAVENQARI
jgi:formate dehydrogenase major subunit